MYGSLMDSLMQSQRNLQDLQRQIASGDKYTKLADNPSAIAHSLQIKSTLNANDKYQENTTNAITMLRYADSAMNNVLDAAQAIRSLIIQAGDGSLGAEQLKDITAQIEANKQVMLDNLNIRVAGKYIFGGTDTSTQPFVERPDGSIEYQGTDERIKYAVSESLLGDVGFAGSDIIPEDDDSYFICSHNVPLDWTWTGREEKVQITVGNRTLSVFIPEDWSDNAIDEANTDYNRYRDPEETTGISLDDLAAIVNRSLEEQGADMLVKVSVEKDAQNGTQQLIMKSNTGEKIGITGWPDTDYMPMPASITSKEIDSDYDGWKLGSSDEPQGLMGTANILSWKGSSSSGRLTISAGNTTEDIDLTQINSSTDLVKAINAKFSGLSDGTPFASFSEGSLKGRLVLQSEAGQITVSGTGNALTEIFGTNDDISSTSSSLTVQAGDDNTKATKIYINADDTLADLAEKINSIEGVRAGTTTDGKNLTVTAQRIGNLQEDRLANNDAAEEAHYPSLTITGHGEAVNLFAFDTFETDDDGNITAGTVKAVSERRQLDHSHMDIFDALGMETAVKSREFAMNETLEVAEGTELHWRVISGGHSTDIKLNPGSYTMRELRERLNNAGAGWLEVTLETDSTEYLSGGTRADGENETQRLVIRGYNGEQVLFLDMNQYNYADKMNLSTALRTDPYTEDQAGTGTKCVNFPSAPCVDDNVGVPVRVQMNCGMYYDVNIKRSEVLDDKTGFVDRTKVMKAIAAGVNEQEGHDVMGCTVHIGEDGQEIPGSSAIYFLSGEAFSVVDLPFSDPEWSDYSGGIAAQLGIHGGISSNLKYTAIPMKDTKLGSEDDYTFSHAYEEVGEEFRPSTIHIENLGHEVDIDIVATDTVKDVMDRIRSQAGDWLYVNYYDEHMGQTSARNAGDYPLISISSVDGSAVSIIDLKGHAAQDALGISTGVQTRLNLDGEEGNNVGVLQHIWNMDSDGQSIPATELTLTVAGYTHTIDLTEIRDVSSVNTGTKDAVIDMYDIAEFINARMQDYDVRAQVTSDKELALWSKRGYSVELGFGMSETQADSIDCRYLRPDTITLGYGGESYTVDVSSAAKAEDEAAKTQAVADSITEALQNYGLTDITITADTASGTISLLSASGDTVEVSYVNNVTEDFMGEETSTRSYYRGGWNLDGSAETRGIDSSDMYSTGAHSQNATVRSGANTMRQNGFGVINDVISAIESGNRDDLSTKMLPKIDGLINNILAVMSENGALQNRYDYNNQRLTQENAIMTEEYDNLAKIDPAEAISQLMVADYMYQANLAIISRLIQPSLLDFI